MHPIDTAEEFYAHSLAIEREAAERYAEFADHFAQRGDDELARLCRKLSGMEREHFEELVRDCSHLEIPALASGEYRWMEHASPEAPARELMYRVANARQLLEIALAAENRARDFFVAVARTTGSRALRELSSLFAAEELEHVRMVQEAMEAYGRGGPDWEALMGEGVGPGIVTPG